MLTFSQDKDKVAKMVADPATFATTLHVIALTFFGPEIYDWEPEMFEMELRNEFGVAVPPGNQDKLNAIVTAVATDAFYRDFRAFTAICEALNEGEVDFDTFTPDLLPAEMAWALIEVQLSDDDEPAFSPDISAYVGTLLAQEGFLAPPSQLQFARIPEQYLGSTFGEDINQVTNQNLHHYQLIDSYVKEQAELLFEQLKQLPWVTDDVLKEVIGEIRQMGFREKVIPSVSLI